MMENDPILSYQQASARGATPIGQIVALYDTILRDFGRALAAVKTGGIETRVFELNHALTVIGHLQCALDHERGGEPAKHFARFYSLTRVMIVQANFRQAPEPIEELIDLYSGVRQAWYQAELQTHAGRTESPATDRPGDATAPAAADSASNEVDTPQLQWSA